MEIKDIQIYEYNDYRRKVTFSIKLAGDYQISIKLGERPIHEHHCIFDVVVIHNDADFAWTKILNSEECFQNQDLNPNETIERQIVLQARDQYGNYCNYMDWDSEIS